MYFTNFFLLVWEIRLRLMLIKELLPKSHFGSFHTCPTTLIWAWWRCYSFICPDWWSCLRADYLSEIGQQALLPLNSIRILISLMQSHVFLFAAGCGCITREHVRCVMQPCETEKRCESVSGLVLKCKSTYLVGREVYRKGVRGYRDTDSTCTVPKYKLETWMFHFFILCHFIFIFHYILQGNVVLCISVHLFISYYYFRFNQ